jgi:hypothetical protein
LAKVACKGGLKALDALFIPDDVIGFATGDPSEAWTSIRAGHGDSFAAAIND